jgi:hypothetical protein
MRERAKARVAGVGEEFSHQGHPTKEVHPTMTIYQECVDRPIVAEAWCPQCESDRD